MDAGHGIPVLYPKIFTFKIFQNITFFLQGNDSKAQSDNSGTSRFSQWFEKKDPTNNNKPSTQDSQGTAIYAIKYGQTGYSTSVTGCHVKIYLWSGCTFKFNYKDFTIVYIYFT